MQNLCRLSLGFTDSHRAKSGHGAVRPKPHSVGWHRLLEHQDIEVFGVDPQYFFYLAVASATTFRELAAFSF
jgi:hypothetical protein